MSQRVALTRWAGPWLVVLAGCGSTVDPVGYNGEPEPAGPAEVTRLRPLRGPSSYPNGFSEVLGKTEAEVTARIDAAFEQLFFGDPTSEAIYFEDGDSAHVRDILHDDVRTEGMGLGMMVCVQLDRQSEFDRLYRHADGVLRVASGPSRGYFRSRCEQQDGTADCLDPYGMQQILMSLVFAHGRWGSTDEIDYEAEAIELFDVLRNKELENGGVRAGVTNLFDATTQLPFDFPNTGGAGLSRPSAVMPAYYELWAQATGDAFYAGAARSGREYWIAAAHPETGLLPTRAFFDGTPVPGWDNFTSESYRTFFSLVLDRIWFAGDGFQVELANRVIGFFADEGAYGRVYTLDGEVVQPETEPSLVSSNGALALVSSQAERDAFIEALWEQPLVELDTRYYPGMLQLLALITVGGRYRVY